MSLETDIKLGGLERGKVRYFPVVPGRVEFAILRENLPFGDDHILNYVTDFLQQAHAADERYTARDGINIARFAMKLMQSEVDLGNAPLGRAETLKIAIVQTLGEEALRYVARS